MVQSSSMAVVADRDSGAGAPSGWDYSVVTIHARLNNVLEEALREKGRAGWELIYMCSPTTNEYQCVFRRSAAQ